MLLARNVLCVDPTSCTLIYPCLLTRLFFPAFSFDSIFRMHTISNTCSLFAYVVFRPHVWVLWVRYW